MRTLILMPFLLLMFGCQADTKKETMSLISTLKESNQILARANEQLKGRLQYWIEHSFAVVLVYETALKTDNLCRELTSNIRRFRQQLPDVKKQFSETIELNDSFTTLCTHYQDFPPRLKTILDSFVVQKLPNYRLESTAIDALYQRLVDIQRNQDLNIGTSMPLGQLHLKLLQLENDVQRMNYEMLSTIADGCGSLNRGFSKTNILIDYQDIAVVGKPFKFEIMACMDGHSLNTTTLLVQNKMISGKTYTYIPKQAGRQHLDIEAVFTNSLTGETTTHKKRLEFAVLEH